MSQPGEHTWDRFLHYHRCPECGFVFEDTSDYQMTSKSAVKELICPRCAHPFTVVREHSRKKGPLFGKPQPPEMDWR